MSTERRKTRVHFTLTKAGVVAASLLAAACTTTSAPHANQVLTGSDLSGNGAQLDGALVLHNGRVGEGYRLAFPTLSNMSKQPIKIIRYELQSVPKGVIARKVSVYDANETGGIALAYRDSEQNGFNLSSDHNYAGRPLILGALASSSKYAMLDFRIETNTNKVFSGCVIFYEMGDHLYRQVFHCKYAIQMKGLAAPRL